MTFFRTLLMFVFVFSLVGVSRSYADINETTSRSVRTDYFCKIATQPNLKPNFNEMDAFRIDKGNLGVADLYADGTLEIIAGFSDEMFESTSWLHEGNHERSQGYSEYMVFSPKDNFKIPNNFDFWMARNILASDFNGDGIDDLVFIQHGRDFQPWSPQPNIVMLSSPNGYKRIKLDGKGLHHGGATGDIDGDGDIDIVATVTNKKTVSAYYNDGNGKFERKIVVSAGKRYNNVQLWDIDNDGNLDMILDGGGSGFNSVGIEVYWGDGLGQFKSKTEIKGLKNRNMQDAEFTDLDKDGNVDILLLSSLKGSNQKYYSGYSIDTIEFDGRNYNKVKTIHEQPEDPNDWVWWPYFSGCDLNNDGDIDIVIEAFGQFGNEFTYNLDKVVFHNELNKFTKYRVLSTLYLSGNFYKISKVQDLAKKLGISVKRYDTDKTYFPLTDNIKRDKKHHIHKKNNVFHVWWKP